MLAAGTIALTSLAGQTVVKAAGTDTWEAAKQGIARLLGRGDQEQEQLAEHRLEQTRAQLAKAAAPYGELSISLRSSGRHDSPTFWRTTRTSRLTCAFWCSGSRRSCPAGWCPPTTTRSLQDGMSTSRQIAVGFPARQSMGA